MMFEQVVGIAECIYCSCGAAQSMNLISDPTLDDHYHAWAQTL